MPKDGDLIRTTEGYYGIVTNQSERTVFLGNGTESDLEPKEFENLVVMPMNIFHTDETPRANFTEFVVVRKQLRRVVETGFTFPVE